jgi:hypothetical protein
MGTLLYPEFVDPPSADETSAVAQARQRVIKQAKELLTPVQGGAFLGELVKTIHMVKHPATSLRKSIDDYFRVLKKVPRRTSSAYRRKALNDTYLEFTYGWRPLMGDIQNGIETLRRYVANRPCKSRQLSVVADQFLLHTPPNPALLFPGSVSGIESLILGKSMSLWAVVLCSGRMVPKMHWRESSVYFPSLSPLLHGNWRPGHSLLIISPILVT